LERTPAFVVVLPCGVARFLKIEADRQAISNQPLICTFVRTPMPRSRRPLISFIRKVPVVFELLEPRRLYAITLDANGFSQFDSSGKTIVYVSNAGSDSNNGLSQGSPVQTIGRAKQLINNGTADWMMLKRGDVFGSLGVWTRSGPSASDPLVIGAYGTAGPGQDPRAVIHSGTSDGFDTLGNGGAVNNFAIVGLHFYADGYNGVNSAPTGIRLLKQGSGILVEDTVVEAYKDNIVLQGDGSAIDGFTLRRSIIVDSYAASGAVGHSQGLYVSGTSKNVLVEENVFDHNGWREGFDAPTVFNHNMYINTGAQGVVVRGNIVSRGSENGILLRAGGVVQNNLLIRNSVGAIVSNLASEMTGNVVLEGVDLPNIAQGIGLNSVKLPSLNASNNIIAHDTSNFTSSVAAIALQWGISSGSVGNNIIFDWRHGVSSGGANVAITNNQIQEIDDHHPLLDLRDSGGNYSYANNIYSSPAAAPFVRVTSSMSFDTWQSSYEPSAQNVTLNYLDPWRDVGTYGATFTGTDGTFDGWINAARAQSSLSWNPLLMAQPAEDWIREGFTVLDPLDPRGSNFKVIVNVTASDSMAKEPIEFGATPNTGTFTFTRTGPIDQALPVTYSVPLVPEGTTGWAEQNVDYLGLKLSFTFQPGERVKTEKLVPMWDGEVEGNEMAQITLNPGAGYTVGPRKRATIIIDDADDTTTPSGGSGGGGTGTGGGGGGTGGGGTPTGGGGSGGGLPGEPPISGDGLFGQYWNDESLAGTPDFTRLDYLIDMDFGTNSPGGSIQPTTWSSQWTGQIEPEFGSPTTEPYTFRLPANDGARLWVNNQLVIDNWDFQNFPGDANQSGKVDINDFNILAQNFGKSGMGFTDGDFDGSGKVDILDFNLLALNFGKSAPPQGDSGTINLLGDTKYDIKIQFHNTSGPANVVLYWSSPSQEEEVVPHERLYSGFVAQSSGTTTTQSFSLAGTPSGAPIKASPSAGTQTIGSSAFSTKTPITPIDDTRDALALADLV
jgi:hypothetical protein